MDYNKLIEKYWAGETSLEEEKILKAYFLKEPDSNSADLKPYRDLFLYFNNQRSKKLETSVESLVSTNKPLKISYKSNYFYQIRSVAAAIVLLIFFALIFQKNTSISKEEQLAKYWASKEIKDPKKAYQKTRAALMLVSQKLNQGTEAAFNQVNTVQQIGKFIKSPD